MASMAVLADATVSDDGLWSLGSDYQNAYVGDEFVLRYMLPSDPGDTDVAEYSDFVGSTTRERVDDGRWYAHRATVTQSNIISQDICFEIRDNGGNWHISPIIDTIEYNSIELHDEDVSSSWSTYCFELNTTFSGQHYFGITCDGCSDDDDGFDLRRNGVDTNSYFEDFDDGASWSDTNDNFNLWVNVHYSQDNGENASLWVVEPDETIMKLQDFSASIGYNDVYEYLIEAQGTHQFFLRRGASGHKVDWFAYSLNPPSEILESMLQLTPMGADEVEINNLVVHKWKFNPLPGMNISYLDCVIKRFDGINQFSIINVTEYFAMIDNAHNDVIVQWVANSSYIDEGSSYTTCCQFNVTLGSTEYAFENVAQFVYVNRIDSLWAYVVNIWNKLVGIEQDLSLLINMSNETRTIVSQSNSLIGEVYDAVQYSIKVSGTEYFAGDPGKVFAQIIEDGDSVEYVSCLATIFSPNGSLWSGPNHMDTIQSVGAVIFEHDFIVPEPIGVYPVSVVCTLESMNATSTSTFIPTSVNIVDGVYDSGLLGNLNNTDGTYYVVNENFASLRLQEIEFTFTGVTSAEVMDVHFDSRRPRNSGADPNNDDLELYIYNYTSASYQEVPVMLYDYSTIIYPSSYTWTNNSGDDFVSGGGELKVKIFDTLSSVGNVDKKDTRLYIDRLSVDAVDFGGAVSVYVAGGSEVHVQSPVHTVSFPDAEFYVGQNASLSVMYRKQNGVFDDGECWMSMMYPNGSLMLDSVLLNATGVAGLYSYQVYYPVEGNYQSIASCQRDDSPRSTVADGNIVVRDGIRMTMVS